MKAKNILAVFSAVLLAACGSGGGSGEPVAGIDAGGGTNPTAAAVVSQGAITGFGSVIVNGVRYDTNGATVSIDDNPGVESDLVVGQVVTVRGTINSNGTTGTATSVSFNDLVEGPIDSINAAGGTMVVLGQTVVVTVDTVFEPGIDPASLAGLAVDQVVEISGYFDAAGAIVATYVDREDNPGEYEVTGIAGNVNGGTFTLDIGNLTVNYSTALPEDFPNGGPENGQLLEAKGTTINAQGQLVATRIEYKGNDNDFGDDQVEIEGFITDFTSATDFAISGLSITTTASTVYLNGTSADLALNRKVEAEGSINANGVLVADKIEFKLAGTLRAEGLVDDVQASQLTVMGVVIRVVATTELKDSSDADIRNFSLADVSVGNYVEIRGFNDATGFVATRLERDDDRGDRALRGFVESVAEPAFEILGVTITTGGGTQFEDVNDAPISPAAFFGNALDRLVDVEGTFAGGVFTAERVAFEN